MSSLIYRFSVDSTKSSTLMTMGLIIVWAFVLGCAISSILTQTFPKRKRTLWIMLVLFVPLLGVLAYLPFSIRRDNYPGLFATKERDRD